MAAVTVPCSCPGSPHESDTVTLRDDVSVPMAVAALATVPAGTTVEDIQGLVTPAYLRFGITGWSFTDDDGKPLPVTPDNIASRLTWDRGGFEVSDAAHGLYSDEVFAPLARRLRALSRTTPTDESTSVIPQSGPPTPISSAPSSRRKKAGKRSADPAS